MLFGHCVELNSLFLCWGDSYNEVYAQSKNIKYFNNQEILHFCVMSSDMMIIQEYFLITSKIQISQNERNEDIRFELKLFVEPLVCVLRRV